MNEKGGLDEQVTIGGPVLPPDPFDGLLYVGPPDDPDRYELQDGAPAAVRAAPGARVTGAG